MSLDNLVNSRAHGPTIRDDRIGPENKSNMDFILTKKPLRLITKFRISNNGHFILVEPVRVDHKETDDLVQFLFKQ